LALDGKISVMGKNQGRLPSQGYLSWEKGESLRGPIFQSEKSSSCAQRRHEERSCPVPGKVRGVRCSLLKGGESTKCVRIRESKRPFSSLTEGRKNSCVIHSLLSLSKKKKEPKKGEEKEDSCWEEKALGVSISGREWKKGEEIERRGEGRQQEETLLIAEGGHMVNREGKKNLFEGKSLLPTGGKRGVKPSEGEGKDIFSSEPSSERLVPDIGRGVGGNRSLWLM